MPGPARARGESAVAQSLECERCHDEIAREHRASLHHRADVEPAYRRAFALEPLPFCRGCHAPEASPIEPESETLAELGVGCVTCHWTGAAVLAAPHPSETSPRAQAPHPVIYDARFATGDACASCHEFSFPSRPGSAPHDKMQWTVTEHERSAARDVPCADCHMPRTAGRRSHLFAASRDPAMLANAARVTASRKGPSTIEITLTPTARGHAFPTGDLFRRIEVLAQIDGPDHMVLGADTHYLGRRWSLSGQGQGRHLLSDNRLFGDPVTVLLHLGPEAETRPIVYRVAYQRVAHPNGTDDEQAVLEGETVLGQGILAP